MRFAILVSVLIITTGLTLSSVQGWDNGGTNPNDPKYGTHDWIAEHAWNWQVSQMSPLNLTEFLYGTELPDNGAIEDGIGDNLTKHHVYFFPNGSVQDNASAQRAQEELDNAVRLFGKHDFVGAARRLGMLTHYISDVASFGLARAPV